MPKFKAPTLAELQAQCDAWNAANPVGTLVSFESLIGEGETHRGESRSEAQVLSGHSAVIWLKGKSGALDLDHCTAVTAPEQLDRAAEFIVEPPAEGEAGADKS